ncbi:expressed unknown protein [Seminavis robusta]|uniref:Uncharacterized protein n=1 Tax=Seminavis robusta TaxID=568900 RepID=A0A9N8DSF8_9STRA|nr:expressed unknown protein [Seminavis robusta]|eukprot:Sro320_g116410.1 n/a (142) ;mRNA; f:7065-7490
MMVIGTNGKIDSVHSSFGIVTILTAIQNNAGDQSVQEQALKSLRSLAFYDDTIRDCTGIPEVGGIVAILTAMENHLDNSQLQEEARMWDAQELGNQQKQSAIDIIRGYQSNSSSYEKLSEQLRSSGARLSGPLEFVMQRSE